MGKVRTRFIGLEDLEEQQKQEQKRRAAEKKTSKKHDPADDAAENAEESAVSAVTADEVEDSKKAAPKKSAAKDSQTASSARTKSRGKNWKQASKKVSKEETFTIADGLAKLKEVSYAKFDETVELHLNVEKKGIKGEVSLPHGTGKQTRVRIVDDKTLDEIENGVIEFDVLVAHPSFMPKLAKHARVLGPKGLMPNPKTGTVSPKPEEIVAKFEKGVLQWKAESKFPLVHQMIGKLSAQPKDLEENIRAFVDSVGVKQIKDAYLTASMTPSVKIDMNDLTA